MAHPCLVCGDDSFQKCVFLFVGVQEAECSSQPHQSTGALSAAFVPGGHFTLFNGEGLQWCEHYSRLEANSSMIKASAFARQNRQKLMSNHCGTCRLKLALPTCSLSFYTVFQTPYLALFHIAIVYSIILQ